MIATLQMTNLPPPRRVDLPSLLFPPSPPHSHTPSAGPSQIRSSNLTSQHNTPPYNPPISIDSDEEGQGSLSLAEAQGLAKGRLRSVACLWRDSEEQECGGILASVDLLQKHIARHVHAYAENLDQNGNEYVATPDDADSDEEKRPRIDSLGIRCHWDRCSYHNIADYEALLEHINTVHVNKLVRDHCPHKDCIGKALSETTEKHAHRAHPGLWTEDRLRQATPKPYPISPVQILRPLPGLIAPWLLSCHPVLAKAKSTVSEPTRSAPIRAARRSREQSESSSTTDKIWPIMNIRDPNDYWPMHGEAEPEVLYGNSSASIFPPVNRETFRRRIDPIQRLRRWAGRENAMELKVSMRPALPRRSRVFTGMDIHARAVRADIAARKEEVKLKAESEGAEVKPDVEDPKGKRKANDDLPEERGERYPVERIAKASSKRARRVTGRTIGYEHLEEMVSFEQRGIELGELPPDYSLEK